MTQNRIMYVCTSCSEHAPEDCGHFDPNELRVMPNGDWLCLDCFLEATLIDLVWDDLPSPLSVDEKANWDLCIEFNNRDGFSGIRKWTRLPADYERWKAEPDAGRFEFFYSKPDLTAQDYEEARQSHLSHVLDLDRAMNGDGAAKAPLLIDIKDQLLERIHRKPFGWAWRQKGRTDWHAWTVIKIKPDWLNTDEFEIKVLYE